MIANNSRQGPIATYYIIAHESEVDKRLLANNTTQNSAEKEVEN